MAEEGNVADIMETVFTLSDSICSKSWHYQAHYYFRDMLKLKKKNLSILSAPNRRYYMRGHRDLITEDKGEVEYSAPGIFARNVHYTYGSEPRNRVAHRYITDFFNITIHQVYLHSDHTLSPLHRSNAKHYTYTVDSIRGDKFFVSFNGKKRNMQIVSGFFVFDKKEEYIKQIQFSGEYNFVTFTENIIMGQKGNERFWPREALLNFRYWYYGNRFTGAACYTSEYAVIEDDYKEREGCDMTELYATALTTEKTWTDSVHISMLRPIPLNEDEKRIYQEAWERNIRRGQTPNGRLPEESSTPQWLRQVGNVGEVFFHSHNIIKNSNTLLRIKSPNIGYSGRNGVTYRQDLEYRKMMKRGRSLNIRPTASYFFGRKELTGRIATHFVMDPIHNGMIKVEGGIQTLTANRDRMKIAEFVGEDSIKVPETMDFYDLFLSVDASREITNGMDLALGLRFHDRRPRAFAAKYQEELELHGSYRDAAPHMTLSFTPQQKYYREAFRKVRTTSKWPTFVLSYERGIKGFLGSTNKYEKLEAMATHDERLSPLHRMVWKMGWGMFASRGENRFLQYEYFNNGITTYNWDDDLSGVFQLLHSKYYNNSNQYLRGHIVLEGPTLLLGKSNIRLIRSERFYINALGCEKLVPYIELGYGISNAMFDMSFFSSYMKKENFKFGVKVSLSLFD